MYSYGPLTSSLASAQSAATIIETNVPQYLWRSLITHMHFGTYDRLAFIARSQSGERSLRARTVWLYHQRHIARPRQALVGHDQFGTGASTAALTLGSQLL